MNWDEFIAELENRTIRERFFARKIAKAAISDEGVFSADQVLALNGLIDGLTGEDDE